jgi:acetyltransferase EpsM
MNILVLIGASGFGREVLWVCRRAGLAVAGFCDDAVGKESDVLDGVPLLGAIEQAAGRLGKGTRFHCAVGNNRDRQRLADRALAVGWAPAAVVDPAAIIAPDVVVGDGTFVGPLAIISCHVSVGRFVLINQHTSIGHDSCLGDYSQVCPGASVSGNCVLGTGALLGSNAALLPTRRMGNWSVLGACALGLSDLDEGATVARVR